MSIPHGDLWFECRDEHPSEYSHEDDVSILSSVAWIRKHVFGCKSQSSGLAKCANSNGGSILNDKSAFNLRHHRSVDLSTWLSLTALGRRFCFDSSSTSKHFSSCSLGWFRRGKKWMIARSWTSVDVSENKMWIKSWSLVLAAIPKSRFGSTLNCKCCWTCPQQILGRFSKSNDVGLRFGKQSSELGAQTVAIQNAQEERSTAMCNL